MFEKLWLVAVMTFLANLAYLAQVTPFGTEWPQAEPTYLLTQQFTPKAR
ncbi:hypothetical protein [Trichothermofontia sp.]